MGVYIWILTVVLTIVSQKCVIGGRSGREVKNKALSLEIQEILKELQGINKRTQDQSATSNHVNCDKVLDETSKWLDDLDKELASRENKVIEANWNYLTDLTDENANKFSELDVELTSWTGKQVKKGRNYLHRIGTCPVITDTDKKLLRLLKTLVNGQDVPVPNDKATVVDISTLSVKLEGLYGNAKVTNKDGKVYRIEPELTDLMSTSRDYDTLSWAWKAWRDATGPFMKDSFTKLVAEMNKAARDNDQADVGVSWRMANYETADIIPMVDSLYKQIQPLYQQLHAYVRHKLVIYYGEDKVDPTGPIPAHILGNMWAQEWTEILDLVAPFPDVGTIDVTATMIQQGYTPVKMFEMAEEFFTSIGLEKMTDPFWEKSMIVQPDDRPVQCHAMADDFLTKEKIRTDDDFRIKMCTEVNQGYLQTIHHEMGHVQYFMQYRNQPTLFRNGANAAFHEAIGDTIALSVVTPKHLKTIGLLEDDKSKSAGNSKNCFTDNVGCTKQDKKELNQLMKMALEKVAFLPFGYMIDKWRWDVFNGKITDADYNAKWWQYRTEYQGVKAPVHRSKEDFDPGAKYHVPAFVPYIRYFLSFLGQFQFQEALCKAAGHVGELSTCDIYKSPEAGELLKSVLKLGSSKPWPDVMEKFTGQKEFSTKAIFKYFSPLYTWLQKYNSDNNVALGWE